MPPSREKINEKKSVKATFNNSQGIENHLTDPSNLKLTLKNPFADIEIVLCTVCSRNECTRSL